MRKRRIYLVLLILAVAGVVGLIVAGAFREREPEYGGKRLSEWVRGLHDREAERREAQEAVSHIGTNGLPYLIRLLGHDMSPLKRKFYSSTNPMVKRLRRFWWILDKRDDLLQLGAMRALIQLGPEAEGAVGDLRRLASGTKPGHSRSCAISVLGEMGKPGLPALVGVLTNQYAQGGKWTSDSIGVANYVGNNAWMNRDIGELGIPALLNMSKDPDPRIRAAATNALEAFDPKARERAGR